SGGGSRGLSHRRGRRGSSLRSSACVSQLAPTGNGNRQLCYCGVPSMDFVTTDAGTVPRLTARELAVWRMFLRAHASIAGRLERDLVAEHGLPLAWYEVLLQLAEAPGQRLRMTDLAERVLLSRSGLTRLVDRLVAEGLVERAACPSDARGT